MRVGVAVVLPLRMLRCCVAALVVLTCATCLRAQDGYESKQWSGLSYRMIGPYRGGRVTTVTGVPSEPMTFYMGTVGGGAGRPPTPGTPGST
jgi:hypothetical protein